ncbi:hypothetical protein RCL_jg11271.t1 [Rhizophagus clarus]|uniref:Uncharacterized protein n=1 Tax=Rhizophagus clarus TaxID=94130 RepID=A0A8H3LJQ6_9GLOM|nr:hypothetical protein RCL_jg11271.t1 [Rhizophagus clarus]
MSTVPNSLAFLSSHISNIPDELQQLKLIEFAQIFDIALNGAIQEIPENLYGQFSEVLRNTSYYESLMYQVSIRAVEFVFRRHLETCFKSTSANLRLETDNTTSQKVFPELQEPSTIVEPFETQDFQTVIISESSQISTEDIPKI